MKDLVVLHDPKGRLGRYEGMWIDRDALPWSVRPFEYTEEQERLNLRPTGRFEFRSDGACAEVWEVDEP